MHICTKVHVKYLDKTDSAIYLFMCARCDNDVAAGTYRAECKIKIFLVLTSTDIAAFVQYIGSLNTSTSIILDGNTQSKLGCELFSNH